MAMKTPIPADWDNQEYTCIRVKWPNSEGWLALLAGLLTLPMRGRWWDERTGSVIDAQGIGREILERNMPFEACEGFTQPVTDDFPVMPSGMGGIVIISEDDMGQVVTDVQVVNGKLRVYFGKCCYTDLSLDGVTLSGDATIPQSGEEGAIEVPEGSPLATTSSCAKASRVVYMIETIIDELLDGAQVGDNPAVVNSALKDRLPGIDFGTSSFLAAYTAALNITVQGLASETEDQDIFQAYRYEFSQLIAPDGNGVTADEYAALKSALNTVVNREFDISNYPTAFSSMRTLHQNALWMIGENDIRNQTTLVAATGDEDCTSPDASPDMPTNPLESGYFLSDNMASTVFKSSEGGTFVLHQASVLPRNVYGLLMYMEPSATIPYAAKRMDWTYGTEPFAVQADAWINTSDQHQGSINSGHALVFFPDAAIASELANQLGLTGDQKDHGESIVALGDHITPNKLFGWCFAVGLPYSGNTLDIVEWRYIYKVGA